MKIQINSIDSYNSKPTPNIDHAYETSINYTKNNKNACLLVPIVRIFGKLTSTGHTVCVNVHNVYPYLFIDFPLQALYDGSMNHQQLISNICCDLKNEINKVLRLSLQRHMIPTRHTNEGSFDELLNAPAPSGPLLDDYYIYRIEAVYATSLYGYHAQPNTSNSSNDGLFLKISYVSPVLKARLLQILQNLSSLISLPYFDSKTPPKIYEAHTTFQLQFLADYNLFPNNDLIVIEKSLNDDNTSGIIFRKPLYLDKDEFHSMKMTSELQQQVHKVLSKYPHKNTLNLQRVSNCFLEFDIDSSSILNRKKIQQKVWPSFELFSSGKHAYLPCNGLFHQVSHKNKQSEDNSFSQYSHNPRLEKVLTSTKEILQDDIFHRKEHKFPKYTASKPENNADISDVSWSESSDLNDLFKYCTQLNTYDDKSLKSLLESIPLPFDLVVLNENKNSKFTDNYNSSNSDWGSSASNIKSSEEKCSSQKKDTVSLNNILDSIFENDEALKSDDYQYNDSHSDYDHHHKNDDYAEAGHQDQASIDFSKKDHLNKSENDISTNSFSYLQSTQSITTFKKRKIESSLSRNVESFNNKDVILMYSIPPPKIEDFENLVPNVEYQLPYFEDSESTPLEIAPGFANMSSRIRKLSLKKELEKIDSFILASRNYKPIIKTYRYVKKKPSFEDVTASYLSSSDSEVSQSDSMRNKYNSRNTTLLSASLIISTPKKQISMVAKAAKRHTNHFELCILTFEIFTDVNISSKTSGNNNNSKTKPPHDGTRVSVDLQTHHPITAIFWKVHKPSLLLPVLDEGVLMCLQSSDPNFSVYQNFNIAIEIFLKEYEVLCEFIALIRLLDPDVLLSYDHDNSCLKYLKERCSLYKINLYREISRARRYYNPFRITGRYCFQIWSLVRSEIDLRDYSFENVVREVYNTTVPYLTSLSLHECFATDQGVFIDYFKFRIKHNILLLDSLEIFFKIEEQARLIGIDIGSVVERGSQFRVESLLFRITKAYNMILLSPSRKEVRMQKPLQCLSLVMEPYSNFYRDGPVVVLDFQSLYPSVMIAFNYCYSTCLGRLRNFKNIDNKFGVSKISLPTNFLELNKNDIFLSPNGLMFLKKGIRRSFLATILNELLDARFQLKDTMKLLNEERDRDENLYKLYNSKQLILKLLANVIYGYTSASFSGRMPCSDVSDAIVQSGREILEQSIRFIELEYSTFKVVYGDTDSLFIYMPGRTKEFAFKAGREIALKVSSLFPNPILLKFEKVYSPCFLISKKRYVGAAYENETDTTYKFDAKGIETVRRDSILVQSRIMESSLRILFETSNLTLVKHYIKRQFQKILNNKLPPYDFCFYKEVKFKNYKNLPPNLLLVTEKLKADEDFYVQHKLRIPYLIINIDSQTRLKDKAILLSEFMTKYDVQEIDYMYYINRLIIPSLNRCFNLINIDILDWFHELPKTSNYGNISSKLKMYLSLDKCINCKTKQPIKNNLCQDCLKDFTNTSLQLITKVKISQLNYLKSRNICETCSKSKHIRCRNLVCSYFYLRLKTERKLKYSLDIVKDFDF